MRRSFLVLLLLTSCGGSEDRAQLLVNVRTNLPVDELLSVNVDYEFDGKQGDGIVLDRTDLDGELGSFGVAPERIESQVRLRFRGMLASNELFETDRVFNGFISNERIPVFVCLDQACVDEPCDEERFPTHGAPDNRWIQCRVPEPNAGGVRDPENALAAPIAVAFRGPGDQHVADVAALDDGLVVVGHFDGSLTLDGMRTASGVDGFVARLDRDGAIVWSRWIDAEGDVDVRAVEIADDNRIFVAGTHTGTLTIVGDGPAVGPRPGARDGFVLTLDAAGTTNDVVSVGSAGDDDVRDLALAVHEDETFAVVVGAVTQTLVTDPGCRSTEASGGAFALSLRDGTACEWSFVVEDALSFERIVRDEVGDLVIAGHHETVVAFPISASGRSTTLPSPQSRDAFLVRVGADGALILVAGLRGPGDDTITGLTTNGAITVVAGSFGVGVRRFASQDVGAEGRRVFALHIENDTMVTGWASTDDDGQGLVVHDVSTSGSGFAVAATFDEVVSIGERFTADGTGTNLLVVDLAERGEVRNVRGFGGNTTPAAILGSVSTDLVLVGSFDGTLSVQESLTATDGREGFVLRTTAARD